MPIPYISDSRLHSRPMGDPQPPPAPRPVSLSMPQIELFPWCIDKNSNAYAMDAVGDTMAEAQSKANAFVKEISHQTGMVPIMKLGVGCISVIYFVKENRKVKL